MYLLKNNFGGKEAVLIAEPLRITKTNVRKLVTLSQERLLVAAMSDENLYLIDLSRKESIMQTKGIKNFFYYPGELRPDGRSKIFVVTQNKKGIAYTLHLKAPNLNQIFEEVKVSPVS